MSWKTILKASGCGCNDCNEVSKSRGMSSAGFRGGSRRKPMAGTSVDYNSYEACIQKLTKLYGNGRIDMSEYIRRKKECMERFGVEEWQKKVLTKMF